MLNETQAAVIETEDSVFGDVISRYTRAQAIEDGMLVDVTEWASADKGFLGGFKCPVAVTASVWSDINKIGRSCGDARGRAHDLLFMASLAARRARNTSEVLFQVIMQVGRTKLRTYKMVAGPDDNGALCMTIMQTQED